MLHATVWVKSSVSRLRTWRRARVWNMHAFAMMSMNVFISIYLNIGSLKLLFAQKKTFCKLLTIERKYNNQASIRLKSSCVAGWVTLSTSCEPADQRKFMEMYSPTNAARMSYVLHQQTPDKWSTVGYTTAAGKLSTASRVRQTVVGLQTTVSVSDVCRRRGTHSAH